MRCKFMVILLYFALAGGGALGLGRAGLAQNFTDGQLLGLIEQINHFCTSNPNPQKYPLCAEKFTPKGLRQFINDKMRPEKYQSGLITGYSLPTLRVSPVKTDQFWVPVYGVPVNPQLFTRAEIMDGALPKGTPILCYMESYLDYYYAQVQGSFVAQFPDNSKRMISYGANNGRKYTPIGNYLADKITTMNWQNMREYLDSLPVVDQIAITNNNERFIFFKPAPNHNIISASGSHLIAFHSMAADNEIYPFGTLLLVQYAPDKSALGLVLDTGSAIKGLGRFDVFMGGDLETANKTNFKGDYWVFEYK